MFQQSHIRRHVYSVHALEHPSFCFCAQNSVVRKGNVAEEVNALGKLTKLNLLWMQHQPSLIPQPLLDERQEPSKLGRVVRKNNRIVGVADVVLHPELVLDKMVECIQIHIGK